MANPTNLKPFRDINPHDVINLYALSTPTGSKGQFVKISTGWTNDDNLGTAPISSTTYPNTVSNRYSIPARVTVISSTGDALPIGMLLFDVAEVDENGESLLFHPERAASRETVISGQAVPILKKGIVLYSGCAGTPVAGAAAYAEANGTITPTGFYQVGRFLGTKDTKNYVLLAIDL